MTPAASPTLSEQVVSLRVRLQEMGRGDLELLAVRAQVSVATLYRVRRGSNCDLRTLEQIEAGLAAARGVTS